MEVRGRLRSASKDILSGKTLLTLEVDSHVDLKELEGDLRITTKKWRERRSKDANALFWACVGEIAQVLHEDKWEVYLALLKSYGRFTYILVPEQAVDRMKEMWREVEEVGEVDVNGRKSIQLLCYYGSSTYDTAEMSRLIDGTMNEMDTLEIPRPDGREIRRALEEWERLSSRHANVASSAEAKETSSDITASTESQIAS